jgi:predicted kinase
LKQAIEKCPDALWNDPADKNRFWHVAYHALFYTHLYLQPTDADRLGAVVVGSDEVRAEFQARGENPHDGDAVFAEVERRAHAHLQADRSVILDATHYQRRYRTYAIDLARQLRVPCVAVWFDTPLTTALQRNGWRTGDRFGEQRVPDHIIREMAAHFDPLGRDEFDRVIRIRDESSKID